MVFGLFKKKEPVKCTVKSTGEEFMVQPNQPLMKAAFAAGVKWPHSCKVGSCGSCRATILEGEGYHPSGICDVPSLLKKEEIESGMIIACQWVAKTDVLVDVEIGKEGDKRGMV